MCVKTKNLKSAKVFINICKIQEIPPAPPLSEEKLKNVIAMEDYSSDFRYCVNSRQRKLYHAPPPSMFAYGIRTVRN